jgi:hypothetical protein
MNMTLNFGQRRGKWQETRDGARGKSQIPKTQIPKGGALRRRFGARVVCCALVCLVCWHPLGVPVFIGIGLVCNLWFVIWNLFGIWNLEFEIFWQVGL